MENINWLNEELEAYCDEMNEILYGIPRRNIKATQDNKQIEESDEEVEA